MHKLNRLVIMTLVLFFLPFTAAYSECDNCCSNMGGIHYCDSSAGRYVCGNGDFSACYCTIHAVMDLQKIKGCCLWQGGVMKITVEGGVMCNNGSVSEICGLLAAEQRRVPM